MVMKTVTPLPARPTAPDTSGLVDAEAIARSLKSGEKLRISVKDGEIQAEKTGPDRYLSVKRNAGDAVATGASFVTHGVNGSFGVDPTLSALTAVQTAYSAVSNISLIPSTVTKFFSDNFFPAFRFAAPILDGIKFINTWKMSKAMARAKDPKAKGFLAHFKSGKLGSVIVDGAHVVLDVAVAAAIVGAMIHFPPLALLPKLVALGVGFGGDVAAGAFHGVGAAANLSDPANGATFMQRLKRFLNTQSGTAMIRRVFSGEEPLDSEPPVTQGGKEPGKGS